MSVNDNFAAVTWKSFINLELEIVLADAVIDQRDGVDVDLGEHKVISVI